MRCITHCSLALTATCPPLQLLFRSANKLLMDTATSEYLFCSDFFQEAAVFHELFAPTLQVVESTLAATLQVCTSFDMQFQINLDIVSQVNNKSPVMTPTSAKHFKFTTADNKLSSSSVVRFQLTSSKKAQEVLYSGCNFARLA